MSKLTPKSTLFQYIFRDYVADQAIEAITHATNHTEIWDDLRKHCIDEDKWAEMWGHILQLADEVVSD